MIKITNVRDAMNVKRKATNVNRARCRVGFAGKTEDGDIGLVLRPRAPQQTFSEFYRRGICPDFLRAVGPEERSAS